MSDDWNWKDRRSPAVFIDGCGHSISDAETIEGVLKQITYLLKIKEKSEQENIEILRKKLIERIKQWVSPNDFNEDVFNEVKQIINKLFGVEK